MFSFGLMFKHMGTVNAVRLQGCFSYSTKQRQHTVSSDFPISIHGICVTKSDPPVNMQVPVTRSSLQ